MNQIVRSQYNHVASIYDTRWKKYLEKTLGLFLEEVTFNSHESVLDIGCGTGELEKRIAIKYPGQSIIGIDCSENMLEKAKTKLKKYPQISFKKASSEKLPFPDKCFDKIVSSSAFHYFPNPIKSLKEINRVLKPKGRFSILDWAGDSIFCKGLHFFLKLFDPAYKQCYTQKEMFQMIQDASGFNEICIKKFNFPMFWKLMLVQGEKKDDL